MENLIKLSEDSGASFSDCRSYRWTLWRVWGRNQIWNADGVRSKPRMITFIGLNPSTADAEKNDPTVSRCISRAKGLGFDGMFMANLFSLRATNPADMKAHRLPVGWLNNKAIIKMCDQSMRVVLCWGNHGRFMNRSSAVLRLLIEESDHHQLWCLGKNKSGEPKHPLYIKSAANLVPY